MRDKDPFRSQERLWLVVAALFGIAAICQTIVLVYHLWEVAT